MLSRLFRRNPRPRPVPAFRFRPGVERLDERWLPSILVTNANDTGPGSLRQAITDSNASAGVVDTITFNIPVADLHPIPSSASLPEIKDPVVIDGTTQPGAAPATATTAAVLPVEVDTNLNISAGGCTVRGLVFGGA